MNQFIMTTIFTFLFAVSAQAITDKDNFPVLTQDEMNDIFGAPPDKSIKSWIRFDMLGPVNHPFPIVWVSPQKFRRVYPNHLIKLRRSEYRQLIKFGRANRCSTKFDKYMTINPLRVTEHVDGREQDLCVMPPEKTCDYLADNGVT